MPGLTLSFTAIVAIWCFAGLPAFCAFVVRDTPCITNVGVLALGFQMPFIMSLAATLHRGFAAALFALSRLAPAEQEFPGIRYRLISEFVLDLVQFTLSRLEVILWH